MWVTDTVNSSVQLICALRWWNPWLWSITCKHSLQLALGCTWPIMVAYLFDMWCLNLWRSRWPFGKVPFCSLCQTESCPQARIMTKMPEVQKYMICAHQRVCGKNVKEDGSRDPSIPAYKCNMWHSFYWFNHSTTQTCCPFCLLLSLSLAFPCSRCRKGNNYLPGHSSCLLINLIITKQLLLRKSPSSW